VWKVRRSAAERQQSVQLPTGGGQVGYKQVRIVPVAGRERRRPAWMPYRSLATERLSPPCAGPPASEVASP